MLMTISHLNSKPSGSINLNLRTLESAPNFALPRNVVSEGVFANLKYLLTSRVRKTQPQGHAILAESFRGTFIDNLREFFRPAPRVTGDSEFSLSGTASLGIKIESPPLYLSLLRNIREYVVTRKLHPLEVTSIPIAVPEIWSKQRRFSGANLTSAGLHVSLTAVAVALGVGHVKTVDSVNAVTVLIAPLKTDVPQRPAPLAPTPMPRMTHIKRRSFFVEGKLTAPVVTTKVALAKRNVEDSIAPDLNSVVGSGPPAGILGGVLGGQSGSGPVGFPVGQSGAPPPPGVPVTSSGVVRVGGVVKEPKLIYGPEPEYSSLARRAGVSGIVFLNVTIDEQGNVVSMQTIEGPPLLIASARRAVAKWRFEPTYLNGKPISVEMEVKVKFTLR